MNKQNPVKNYQSIRQMHGIKLRRLRVEKIIDLNKKFKRIVFKTDMTDFISLSFDDHMRLFFPLEQQTLPELVRGADGELTLPDDIVLPHRDYTPLEFDIAAGRLTIDFVIHEHGVATNWAQNARVNDELIVGGPRGSTLISPDFDDYILIGDETALPAIYRFFKEAKPHHHIHAFIEIDNEHEKIILETQAHTHVEWVLRQGIAAHESSLLEQAVRRYSLPKNTFFTWIAAEKMVARRLREMMLNEFNVPKDYLKSAAYWNYDHAEDVH